MTQKFQPDPVRLYRHWITNFRPGPQEVVCSLPALDHLTPAQRASLSVGQPIPAEELAALATRADLAEPAVANLLGHYQRWFAGEFVRAVTAMHIEQIVGADGEKYLRMKQA